MPPANPDGGRLYGADRPVAALTGGAGAGKSTVTGMLRGRGVRVICADELTRAVHAGPHAAAFVARRFPDALRDGRVDTKRLKELVFAEGGGDALADLERFVRGSLPEEFRRAAEEIRDQDFLVYDVPLLFERGLADRVDLVVCVHAPPAERRRRLAAKGADPGVVERMLKAQGDPEEKRRLADVVVENGSTLEDLDREAGRLAALLRARRWGGG